MIFQNDINIQKELKELKTEKLIYDYTFPQLNNDSIQKIKECMNLLKVCYRIPLQCIMNVLINCFLRS